MPSYLILGKTNKTEKKIRRKEKGNTPWLVAQTPTASGPTNFSPVPRPPRVCLLPERQEAVVVERMPAPPLSTSCLPSPAPYSTRRLRDAQELLPLSPHLRVAISLSSPRL